MQLEIITPEKSIYKGEIASAVFPGSEGSFGVLPNHSPIISTLKNGEIKIVDSDKKEAAFSVNGGVVEISNNKIIVLAE
jgi:F-type H+-transporting ATPase subunit epsilon